jgi:hypothetical protein
LAGIFGSFVVLVVTTLLMVPTWPADNLAQMLAYPGYTLAGTPSEIFLEWAPGAGLILGWILTVLMSIILLWTWRNAWMANFGNFYWAACLTLALTNLIGIRTTAENYIALLPGLILIFAEWQRRWQRNGRWGVVAAMFVLFFGIWALFLTTRSGRMQNPILFFPLPLFEIVSLLAIAPLRRGPRPSQAEKADAALST